MPAAGHDVLHTPPRQKLLVEAMAKVEVAVVEVATRFPTVAVPLTTKAVEGVDEPMPTLPLDKIDRTLCKALPKNSAILPAPVCVIESEVVALEVALFISLRKNWPGVIPFNVAADKELVEVPAVVA